MRQYQCFELAFRGEILRDSWAQADLMAEFTAGGITKTVKGFYAGDERYLVRYLPETTGPVCWKVTGAANAEGSETCLPALPGDHGIAKAEGTHFALQDGSFFYPFGTTIYALAHQDDALVEKTLESLQAAPFNKVRMCVFPKHYDYNHNEPPFYPFEKNTDGSWDVGRPSFAFWDRFESILDRIIAMGIQVDLILFHPYDRWGFSAFAQEENLIYLDYLLRRLSAKPGIWWSLANEYDLDARKSLADWEEIEEFVHENDPWGHPLSCHNCFCYWDASREAVTHASIQTKALTEIPRWIRTYKKPVIIDECCYEGDLPHFWGSISGREMVFRFWRCAASGGYCTHGETFLSEDEVLWWSRGGVLKGDSPKRIAFLREILESLPGPLSPVDNGFARLPELSEAELSAALQEMSESARPFAQRFLEGARRMAPADLTVQMTGDHEWAARAGERAFLWFCDLQCHRERTLSLPEGRRYRVEVIDVWEMTRTVISEDASGETKIRLPGKEGLAVLAAAIDT